MMMAARSSTIAIVVRKIFSDSGEHRQHHLVGARQLALDHLALELQADQHEEEHHQRVVDPEQQGLVHAEPAHRHGDLQVQQPLVSAEAGRDVGQHQREHRRDDQEHAAGGLQLYKVPHQINNFCSFLDVHYLIASCRARASDAV